MKLDVQKIDILKEKEGEKKEKKKKTDTQLVPRRTKKKKNLSIQIPSCTKNFLIKLLYFLHGPNQFNSFSLNRLGYLEIT